MSAVTAIGIGYVVCMALVACRVATLLAWRFHKLNPVSMSFRRADSPNGEQWAGGALLGFAVALLWPAVLIAYAFRQVLFAPPRDVRIAQRDRRIKELERELGL